MPQNLRRFQLHAIAVDVRGPGADAITKDFDYFLDRPPSQEEAYTITLEILPPRRGQKQPFALESRRDSHFSVGQLFSDQSPLAEQAGREFLAREVCRLLERQGYHRWRAMSLGLPNGNGALLVGAAPSPGLLQALLRTEGALLLAHEISLTDPIGRLLPFPSSIRLPRPAALPDGWKEKFTAIEGETRLASSGALPIGSLARPDERFQARHLVILEEGGDSSLVPAPRWKAAWHLARAVIKPVEVSPAQVTKAAASAALVGIGRPRKFCLGTDDNKNAEELVQALLRG